MCSNFWPIIPSSCQRRLPRPILPAQWSTSFPPVLNTGTDLCSRRRRPSWTSHCWSCPRPPAHCGQIFFFLYCVCASCQNKLSTNSIFYLSSLQAAPFTLSTIFLVISTIIHLGVWLLQRLARLLIFRIMTNEFVFVFVFVFIWLLHRLALLVIIRIITNEFYLHRFTGRRQDYDRILWEIKSCEHPFNQSIQIWIICSES